ncbi:MAG: hypothetical protein HFI09_01160 [Bacilli bacterium]|nr:hypothetical protein [Bacilli bacterium]
MNKSIEVLKDIYKPIRYTKRGKITILETTSGNFVVKPKENDIAKVYRYLQSRNFHEFPELVDFSRADVNMFSYVEDTSMPVEQKAEDLIGVLASLHQKTAYFKTVSLDTYQEIYENVDSNIQYLRQYYDALFDTSYLEVYMSPSHYLFMRNSSKILSSLDFAKRELDDWFELVKQESRQRVSFIHNNMSLDHYLKGDRDYFISWEKSKIDSPVLDLVHFYQTDYFDVEFQSLFQKYQEKFPLLDAEKKLFFILISLPMKITLTDNEFQNCKSVRESLDYLFKTEELVRPYYSVEQK